MTTEQNQIKKIAIYTFLGIVFWVIVALIYFKGCTPTPQPTLSNFALDSTKNVTEYKRKVLTDKLNVLQNFDTNYMDRWHIDKVKTDSVIAKIATTAPDTCDKWIIMCENRLYAERQIADSTITIKDSIIGTQSQIIKEDSVLLQVSKEETKKAKRKGFVKGFLWGFGTASVINQLIK
jgi:hypothetical protein